MYSSLGYYPDATKKVYPMITFTFNCFNDDVIISGGAGGISGSVRMTKESFGILIVLIDIICTLLLIFFYKTLEKQ